MILILLACDNQKVIKLKTYVPDDNKDGRYYDFAKGNVNRCTGGILALLGEEKFLVSRRKIHNGFDGNV
jgi:hypothetical protein